MNDDIRGALWEELMREFEKLKQFEPGSKEHQIAAQTLQEMYKVGLADVNADTDYVDKLERREMEKKQNERESEINKKNSRIRFAIEIGEKILSIGAMVGLAKELCIFEQTNTIRSPWIRTIFTNLIPKIGK